MDRPLDGPIGFAVVRLDTVFTVHASRAPAVEPRGQPFLLRSPSIRTKAGESGRSGHPMRPTDSESSPRVAGDR
jgi:hypothetical protein